jgi:hypothetical protein
MIEIRNKLDQLKNLSTPETFIEETKYYYNTSEDIYPNKIRKNDYFINIWKDEYDDFISELLLYCGIRWQNYIFDLFYPIFKSKEMEYFIHRYISESSKTISKYFQQNMNEIFDPRFEKYPKTWKTVFRNLPPQIEYINRRFYYDFSEFLENRVYELFKNGRVYSIDRTRISKASGIIFKDSNSGNSISYFHRSIIGWDLQNYIINIFPYEFDSYKKNGLINEIKNNISNLRNLFDFLGFIPNINGSIYSVFRNIPIEKYIDFVKLQKQTFSPYEYKFAYGSWLNAIIASGYLGINNIKKNTYGYRVIAEDGHSCNSLSEKIIDDWLFNNKIEHIKEPKYPKCIVDIMGANVKADWLIEDTYIEYFGLQNEKEYAKKSSSKILSCEINGIKLIPLYPGDEYHLEKLLKDFI